MRRASLAVLLVVLAIAASSCTATPADRQAISDAWAARDRERAAECRRNNVGFAAGGCTAGGP